MAYNVELSFKNTQLTKPKFFISKEKVLKRLTDEAVKNKAWIPGAGHYNIEKAFDKSTRGAARGWK